MSRRREPPSTFVFLALLLLPIIVILLSLIRSRVTVPPFTEEDRAAFQRQLDWPVYAAETFDDNYRLLESNVNWGQDYEDSDDYDVSGGLADGEYSWWIGFYSPKSTIRPRWLITEHPLEDFVLTTDMLNNGNYDHGVIFNYRDEENYYMLTINKNGELDVKLIYQGEWESIFTGMSFSELIRPYRTNQLTLSFEDGQGLVFINEQYVTQFKDTRISQGHLGFVIEIPAGWDGATIVYIDNFILRIPDQTGGGD